MRKKYLITGLLFIFIVSLGFSYFTVNEYLRRCRMKINKINLDRAYKLFKEGRYIFLDVREADELKKRGTIPGAKHIPRGLLEFRIGWITGNNLNTPIIVFSNGEKRSTLAAFTLSEILGYRKVYRLDHGYEGWKRKGYPTTLSPSNKAKTTPSKIIIKKKIFKKR